MVNLRRYCRLQEKTLLTGNGEWIVKHRNLILAVAMAFLVSACDQFRSDLADLLSPPSETQVAARMVDLLNAGKSSQAIAMGEKYRFTS